MGGEVGFAGRGERIGEAMVPRPLAAYRRRRSRHGRNRRSARRPARAWPARRAPRAVRLPPGASRRSRLRSASMPCTDAGTASRLDRRAGAESEAASVAERDAALMPGAAARTNCRTGSASMNSLAMTMSGPCGTSSIALVPVERGRGAAQRLALRLAQHGARLDQRDRSMPSSKLGHAAQRAKRVCHQRAAPGSKLGDGHARGSPMVCQTAAAHTPISSPNIWLISGAVMKSPSLSDRLARRVIARAAVGEAGSPYSRAR